MAHPEPDRPRGRKNRGDGAEVPSERFVGQADPCGAWEHPGSATFELTFDGRQETSIVHVPPGSGPRRVVFVLHGGDGDGAQMLRQTDILPVSEAEGFVVVAPSGAWIEEVGQMKWNTGKQAHPDLRDDVRYLDALAEAVGKATCGEKVLAMGFSNGGQMANRWMCEGERVDAMVTGSGTLLVDPSGCKPKKRAVLGYVGTEDHNFRGAPTEGGMSAPDTVDRFWAGHNGCTEKTKQVVHGDTTCNEYVGCDVPTTLCVIDGFPHAFPRGQNGRKRCDTDATEAGWKWFVSAVP